MKSLFKKILQEINNLPFYQRWKIRLTVEYYCMLSMGLINYIKHWI